MSSVSLIQPERDLFSYTPYWAECFRHRTVLTDVA
ncbi:Uncharacterised protein [Edwardsiella tarda]|nr:Uncharacterised protein [Edwardsiella tarda]